MSDERPPAPQPMLARTITFSYDEGEDRVLVNCKAEDPERLETLMLSRRMVRNILRTCAGILAQSSERAGRTPSGYREDVLAMEHLGAVASSSQHQSSLPPMQAVPTQEVEHRHLVLQLDIDSRADGGYMLRFHDRTGMCVATGVTRVEMHHVLDALVGLSRRGEWGLDAEAGWLASAGEALRPGRAGALSS
ncbi:MAG TPA: hypothetical protein VED40_05525 [Azospirillaceae bacterium]|nr:hypothetical protein [Azospirillaceae bacterium]